MFKCWITTVADGKIIHNLTCDWPGGDMEQSLRDTLDQACPKLDLSRPIIMKKHVDDLRQFHRTRFLPDHFIDDVPFDRMELEVFEAGKKRKINPAYL